MPRPSCRASAIPSSATRYRHHYFAQPARARAVRRHAGDAAGAEGAQPLARAWPPARSRRGLDEALNGSQLQGLFDATRTADETASKPDPRMLLELMREFGVDARAHADDRRHDARPAAGASNAGTASVGVSYGAHEHDAFAELRAAATSRTRLPTCTTGWPAMPDVRRRGPSRSPVRRRPSSPSGAARVLFDVLHFGEPARAFALRFDGRVVAYLNRCAARADRDGLAARRVPRQRHASGSCARSTAPPTSRATGAASAARAGAAA